MNEDLELTICKEEVPNMETFQCKLDPVEEKPKRERAKLYAVIVASDSKFDCVIVAEDKKDLQTKIISLEKEYSDNGMSFSIVSILKGHEIKFKETKAIEFI